MIKEFGDNNHKIFYGDSISILNNKIPDNSIDLIFVDPPYNIGKIFNGNKEKWDSEEHYLNWCYIWLDLCISKLKDNGSIYIMNATQNIPFIDIYLRDKMTILSRIMWHYDSSGVQAKKYYGSLYEPIIFAVKNSKKYTFNYQDIMVEARTGSKRKLIDYRGKEPKPYSSNKVPGNTWYYPRVRYRMPEYEEHPSQKPEALLERIIKASSNIGDVVLDPFSGTFTTSAVAQKLCRKSIGIELEESYVKTGIRRLNLPQEYTNEKLKSIIKKTKNNNREGNISYGQRISI